MTTIFLVAEHSPINWIGVYLTVAWVLFSLFVIGKVDFIQYALPFLKKRKRRKAAYEDFKKNFEVNRKNGMSLQEYEMQLHKLQTLKRGFDETSYGPFETHRYNNDPYQRDAEGNRVKDKLHIIKFDNEPVYADRLKPAQPLRDNNGLRVITLGGFMVIIFIWLIINS